LTDPAPQAVADQQRRAALTRMKGTATALLVLMTLVFIGTFFMPAASWVGYLRAFTEAAMVGALADWFAVTALFRHPLGLPIPHTAIIVRGKDQLGDALARFVRQNFMTPEVLRPRIESIDFGARRRRAARVAAENRRQRFHSAFSGRESAGRFGQHESQSAGSSNPDVTDRRRSPPGADG